MKAILLLVSTLLPTLLFSQEKVVAENISINFDKVIHIIISSDVEYVSSGSEYIDASIVDEKKSIVRVSALTEDFSGSSNVTIIGKNGKIYTYNFKYCKEIINEPAVLIPDTDNIKQDYQVIVNTKNTTHLIFPSDIIYMRQGNEDVLDAKITSASNIVMVTSKEEPIYESNLFCVDKNGEYYHAIVNSGVSSSYVYNLISDSSENPLAKIELNENNLEQLCQKSIQKPQNIYSLGTIKDKYLFSLNNIFVKDELLLFVFQLNNNSNIDIDIDFVKCFFVDKKPAKNAVLQEDVVEHVYQKNFNNKIKSKSSNKFVLVFDKFTIPDKKVFKVEIYERGGGRHINFVIENNTIMDAKKIL